MRGWHRSSTNHAQHSTVWTEGMERVLLGKTGCRQERSTHPPENAREEMHCPEQDEEELDKSHSGGADVQSFGHNAGKAGSVLQRTRLHSKIPTTLCKNQPDQRIRRCPLYLKSLTAFRSLPSLRMRSVFTIRIDFASCRHAGWFYAFAFRA